VLRRSNGPDQSNSSSVSTTTTRTGFGNARCESAAAGPVQVQHFGSGSGISWITEWRMVNDAGASRGGTGASFRGDAETGREGRGSGRRPADLDAAFRCLRREL